MTKDQERLLEAVLHSLDRLFDRQCTAVDVQALTAATAVARECLAITGELREQLAALPQE